jgi:DNA/RNA-binding domain of Phe-tRNA-synthetase-like protein
VSNEAQEWLQGARVDRAVFALRPDYRALVIVAEGLAPGPSDEVSDELLRGAESRANAALAGGTPEDLEAVRQWREAFRAFGAKPQRTRPSVEGLLRRVAEGLPRIDRLTDAYNAVSVTHQVPIGGEDLSCYIGTARLARAVGDEPFETTGGGEPVVEHPEAGEVVWRDDAGVTCRRWNWRQCVRTRITDGTERAVFIIDGLAVLGTEGLATAGDDLTRHLARLSPRAGFALRQVGPEG